MRMEDLLLEYLPILIFIGLAGVLGGVLILVPLIVAPSKPDPEKLSAYECGFPAFGDARMMAFLGVLTVGFIYEWKKGALEWE